MNPKPPKKRSVLKAILGAFGVLLAIFFLVPLTCSGRRDSIIPRELQHLYYPGPRNDGEYRELVAAVRSSKGAPHHSSMVTAVNVHASVRFMEILANEFLPAAKSPDEFREYSSMIDSVYSAIHSKAGVSTIDYPKGLVYVLTQSAPADTNETLQAWKDRAAELKRKFPAK